MRLPLSSPLRASFLQRVRLHHVLVVFAAAHHGTTVSSTFVGDGDEGRYVHLHPDGPALHVAWDPAGVVLLAFDPGRSGSEWNVPVAERAPEGLFARCPEALRHLVSELILQTDRLATAALWIATPADGPEDFDLEGEDSWMDRLLRAARGEVEGAAEILAEDDVGPEVARAATGLSARSARGPTTVTPEEEVMLLTPPGRPDAIPSTVSARQARELLAEVGVTWLDAEAKAKRVADERSRLRELGDVDRGLALLTAVHRGELAAVAALVAAGANLERPTPPDLLPYVWVGETPLGVAVYFRHHAIAQRLLEHGADPNRQVGGMTPLARAVQARDAAMCRMLVDAGARFTIDWNDRTRSVLEYTQYHQEDATVMRLLLDAGAPLPGSRMCTRLADVARRAGADDLVARLLPG